MLNTAEKITVSNNIDCVSAKYCTGCKTCLNICPAGAIDFVEDDEGFIQPKIDNSKCTNCGMCKKACPSLNFEFKNDKTPLCYSAKAQYHERIKSSSGGIFTTLAKHLFKRGGG